MSFAIFLPKQPRPGLLFKMFNYNKIDRQRKSGKVEIVEIIKIAGKELFEAKKKIIQVGTEEEVDFTKYDWQEIDEHYKAVVEKNDGFFDSYLKGNSEILLRIIKQKSET